MTLTYQLEPWPTFWADSPALRQEHNEESGGEGLPEVAELEYMDLWMRGMLQVMGVRDGLKLVGYFGSVIRPDPHHLGELIAREDAYFLSPAYRRGLVGMRMIREAEGFLRAAGVHRMFVDGKAGTEQLFARMAFRPRAMVYEKELAP